VPYEAGEVHAAGKAPNERTLAARLKTVASPVKILLVPDTTTLKADAHDVALVEVRLLDQHDNRALLADNLVHFEVSGEGRIIGIDNGDASSLENFKSPKRKACSGRCMVVVRTTGKSGTIKLTAKSEGLPDATVEIRSE
jgi:beta-galactosidase